MATRITVFIFWLVQSTLTAGEWRPQMVLRSDTISPVNIEITDGSWGNTRWNELTQRFSAVLTFYSRYIDFVRKPIYVRKSQDRNPPIDYPMTVDMGSHSDIFLSSENNHQPQFLYQWSHEIMHYIIDRDFMPEGDKFAWFEESICELSSLYVMTQYSYIDNSKRLPNSNYWTPKNIEYGFNLIKSDTLNQNDTTTSKFISNHLDSLEGNRELRGLNRVVAVDMLPHFIARPELWRTVTYLSRIPYDEGMTFKEYIEEWYYILPSSDRKIMEPVYRLLTTDL